MKKFHKTPFALAMGASLLPLTTHIAQAETNPFALSTLSSGYMQTAETAPATPEANTKMKDGACGEGKCGAAMKKVDPTSEKKAIEGKCATNKPVPSSDTTKNTEGNCGANKK
ncbi:hypothetical protein [Methylomonas sp. AM2-LC]|uniref:hypothetical protein n=1 Tax=Methylomonas sp. AM2-LC TaxID=3153301 RepID=UPI003264F52A